MEHAESYSTSSECHHQTQLASHRERLNQFIRAYSEFDREENLHKYYLQYEDESQNYLLQFWSDVIHQYQVNVSKSFTINLAQLTKDFTLHERVPVALPSVIRQMQNYASKEDIVSGKYYHQNEADEENPGFVYSVGAYMGQKLYDNTFGYFFG